MMLTTYVLVVTLGLLHSTEGTPVKPKLSSFTAEITVYGPGTEINHVKYYADAKERKQLQILPLGSVNETIRHYTWLITTGKNMVEYDNTKPFDICTGISAPSEPGMSNIWFWLTNATYNGTERFLNKTLNIWTYNDKVNENYYQLGVLSNDTTQPVYYLSSTAIGLIVFENYDDSAPPASVFEIPTSCKGVIPPERFENKHSSNVFNFKHRS